MVKHDDSREPDWAGVLGKLELDRDAIAWSDREALLPLDWQPEETPSPKLLAVISLLSSDSKWQVRRRVASTLVWLPDSHFGELAARLTQDTHAYVRRDAERAIDRRQRGLQSRKSSVQGGLVSEYSSMERLYRINESVKMKVGVRKQNLVLAGNGTDGTDKWPNGTNDGTVNVTVEDLDVTDLNERQVWIMAMVDRGTEVRVSMVVEHFRCSVRTAKRDLGELKDKELIRFVGSPRNGYYRLV